MGNKKEAVGIMKKIIILHGWAYSIKKWEPFINELRSNKIEVEVLKIPGLTAELDKVWNIDDYVEWFNKIASKEKQPINLLGHSNGGRIAISFANKYPEKIGKLILIDSAGIYHNEFSIRLKRLIFGIAAKTGKKLTSSLRMRRLLYKLARERDYEEVGPIVRATMANLLNSDKIDRISGIKVSTIIIWGAKDKVTPLSDGKAMNRKIENSKLYSILSARHSPMFTHPKEVCKIIIKSL